MKRTAFSSRRLAAASILVLAAAVGACSDSNNDNGGNPSPASTDYVGLLASTDGDTGPLSITFASPVAAPPAPQTATGPSFSSGAPVNATGTVSLGGSAPVAISGSVNGGALSMTGGGWTLTGTLLDGKITGTFTGPGGVSGSLAAISSTEGSPALAFCGTFTGTDVTTNPPSPDLGTFSAVVAGTVVLGTAVGDGGTVTDFSGSATATSFTVSKTQGTVLLSASGTYNATSTNGTYNIKVSGVVATSGTFTGSICSAAS
jgi:hypothetical protein